MKPPSVQKRWTGPLLAVVLIAVGLLEFYGKIFETGIGYYLKWQNHKRPQLGRVWERDRQEVVAQRKIQSIRAILDSREQSADSIHSLKQLFEQVEPSFPMVITRKKFLRLYYDYPGQWSERIISPYELLELDSRNNWDRVLLHRFGQWITIGFLDQENIPIREIYMSVDSLSEVQATRTIRRGMLEEAGFPEDRIFPIDEFLPVLKTLDAHTRKAVFPDPRWFMGKNYRIGRVGVSETRSGFGPSRNLVFGIEYDTDYETDVLLIPVPLDIANNILSQIEGMNLGNSAEDVTGLVEPIGEIH